LQQAQSPIFALLPYTSHILPAVAGIEHRVSSAPQRAPRTTNI